MNSKERVSIITPTYNCARFIEETIQSVLAQTYSDWELIISDDSSIDNTREVIAPYMEQDPRIKYICNTTNSGAAVTRNNALKIAQGRWIAFLDSDDLWHPEKLERQLQFMQAHNYAFSYTAYKEMDEQGHLLGRRVTGPAKISTFGMYAYCWPGCLTVMYDSEKVGLIQIEDIKKNNDYAMWLKVIRNANCYLLNETLATYRRRSGSISNHSYWNLIKWHYRLFREADKQSFPVALFWTIVNLGCGVWKKLYYTQNRNV